MVIKDKIEVFIFGFFSSCLAMLIWEYHDFSKELLGGFYENKKMMLPLFITALFLSIPIIKSFEKLFDYKIKITHFFGIFIPITFFLCFVCWSEYFKPLIEPEIEISLFKLDSSEVTSIVNLEELIEFSNKKLDTLETFYIIDNYKKNVPSLSLKCEFQKDVFTEIIQKLLPFDIIKQPNQLLLNVRFYTSDKYLQSAEDTLIIYPHPYKSLPTVIHFPLPFRFFYTLGRKDFISSYLKLQVLYTYPEYDKHRSSNIVIFDFYEWN